MAAPSVPWPPDLAAPQSAAKSFADVLAGGQTSMPDFGSLSSYRGRPALLISRKEVSVLAEPFCNALVGRFPYSRPPIDAIRKFFVSVGLKGACPIGLLDSKHILIRPQLHDDFTRLFKRRTWFVHNSPLVISKWTLDFKSNCEASLVPVWVTLPELPLPFFNKLYVYKIASLLGRPLQVDAATLDLRRPSVARVLVEIDLLKTVEAKVWIGDTDNEGFWQNVAYENLPSYCSFCHTIGHADDGCFKKHPALKPTVNKDVSRKAPTGGSKRQIYIPKVNDKVALDAAHATQLPSLEQNNATVSQDISREKAAGQQSTIADCTNQGEMVKGTLKDPKHENQSQEGATNDQVQNDGRIEILLPQLQSQDVPIKKVFSRLRDNLGDTTTYEKSKLDVDDEISDMDISKTNVVTSELRHRSLSPYHERWHVQERRRRRSAGMPLLERLHQGGNSEDDITALQHFGSQIPRRFHASNIYIQPCPKDARPDEIDKILLDKLGKKKVGRPRKSSNKVSEGTSKKYQFRTQARRALRRWQDNGEEWITTDPDGDGGCSDIEDTPPPSPTLRPSRREKKHREKPNKKIVKK